MSPRSSVPHEARRANVRASSRNRDGAGLELDPRACGHKRVPNRTPECGCCARQRRCPAPALIPQLCPATARRACAPLALIGVDKACFEGAFQQLVLGIGDEHFDADLPARALRALRRPRSNPPGRRPGARSARCRCQDWQASRFRRPAAPNSPVMSHSVARTAVMLGRRERETDHRAQGLDVERNGSRCRGRERRRQ
jgi:hypothetical protein